MPKLMSLDHLTSLIMTSMLSMNTLGLLPRHRLKPLALPAIHRKIIFGSRRKWDDLDCDEEHQQSDEKVRNWRSTIS